MTICTFGQSKEDQTQILQKCIDIPELLQYYPHDNQENLKQLYVNYWHPLLFPIDLLITKDSNPIQFRLMSDPSTKNGDAYFLFKKFEISQGSSIVSFEYYYGNSIPQKILKVNLDFIKVGDKWEISVKKLSKQDE